MKHIEDDGLFQQYVGLVSTMTSQQMQVYVHARLPDRAMRAEFERATKAITGSNAIPAMIQLCARVLTSVHVTLKAPTSKAQPPPSNPIAVMAAHELHLPGPEVGIRIPIAALQMARIPTDLDSITESAQERALPDASTNPPPNKRLQVVLKNITVEAFGTATTVSAFVGAFNEVPPKDGVSLEHYATSIMHKPAPKSIGLQSNLYPGVGRYRLALNRIVHGNTFDDERESGVHAIAAVDDLNDLTGRSG